ncbi:MAG: tannase/feruloyl esterase family alpha/beta hydrolase [Gammaproteobacteria bacterium]|nr:tannase/feruloyl esterase family alpha/beta hydrolase [Gammaproteobacteria bacterium]
MFCRFSATTAPAVQFEVWLPLEGWNGKYQGVGNGGMAGRIGYASMAAALARGYATASTDTGHQAGPIPFDASWASGRADLIEDFGHRALHVTTVMAKRVVAAFYGRPPEYAYYVGCSKGGQQGLMEVQRYPKDFDGVVAGNPAHDWTRFYAGAHLWYSLATLADPDSYLGPEKLALLGGAVNAACDANDGIADGVLEDPRECAFDPATLQCSRTGDDSCLTSKQVTAVTKIWSGVSNSNGEVVFPGLVPGGEASPGGWARWVTGERPFTSLHWLGGEGFFRHFVFEDPDWDFRGFDYDNDLAYALQKVGHAVDANDPDLRPFRDAGGKLIVYHGWSDPDISPLSAIEYFEDVVAETGGGDDAALARTQDFFRLFMAPGMGHCRGGPGPDRFDALVALEQWVEDGVAPVRIVAAKLEGDAVVRTRPLCPYPTAAQWDGRGDPNLAASFSCGPH